MILHRNMPGKRSAVGKDAMIADQAIMSDMRIRHKKIITADDRFSAFTGPWIKSAEFANNIIFTYFQEILFPFIFKVLRLAAEDNAAKDLRALTDGGIALNNAMSADRDRFF